MSRVGNFSSSQIYKLMSKGRGNWSLENTGKAFETYVKEKRWERKLGRSLSKQVNAKATSWGTLVEHQCFNVLDLKYSLVSKDRYRHNVYPDYWTGMPDLITDDIVGDIKSPWTLESFVELLDCLEDYETLKKVKPMYYWQLVSNSILCNRDTAILVVYMPYKKHLEDIKGLAQEVPPEYQNQYAFLNWADDSELPYLPDDSDVNDVNILEFKVLEEDKELLTQRVNLAVEQLKSE